MSNCKNASYATKARGEMPAYKREEREQRIAAKTCERWSDIESAAEYADDVDTLSALLMKHHGRKATTAQKKKIRATLQSAFEMHGHHKGHRDFNVLLNTFKISAGAKKPVTTMRDVADSFVKRSKNSPQPA